MISKIPHNSIGGGLVLRSLPLGGLASTRPGGYMKIATPSEATSIRALQTNDRSSLSSLRNLSAAALVALVGCGSRESHSSSNQTNPTPSPDENKALVASGPSSEPAPRQRPMSAELQRKQERFHAYPSDLAINKALRETRGFIGEAVSDTQSVEMPLGQLRPGYTTHDEGKERQRQIICIIARHASTSEEKVLESIQSDHRGYFENFDLRGRSQDLQRYTGKEGYESNRGKLQESVATSQAAMLQALQDTQVDKIDYSLSLLRELKALMDTRDCGQPHDAKKIKMLSRMCSAHSLVEVTEHISGLERLRSTALGPNFQKSQVERQKHIYNLTKEIDALDEKMNLKWCTEYERMISAHGELEQIQAQLTAAKAQRSPSQVGELIPVNKHDEFKIDLAAYRLRDCHLSIYTLRDRAQNSVATICDHGTGFDESRRMHSISIAIDEPNANVRIKADHDGGVIEASDGTFFERKEIDLKEGARSEIEDIFKPTFITKASVASIPLKGERHEILVRMNPGGVLDLSACKSGSRTKITTEGSGIVIVGESDQKKGQLSLTVKGTLEGEAPLLIALPEGFPLDAARIDKTSSDDWHLSAGNADIIIEKRSAQGILANIDLELKTPRGAQVVSVVRDGEKVLRE